MSQEMIYTSAPKGLKPGSSGFCTVAASEGMSSALIERLELLSSYQPLAAPGESKNNPVGLAHWRVPAGGRTCSVLSRVMMRGLDYTRRPNKLAHHIVLDAGEQPEAGPAWALMQPGLLLDTWSGPPRLITQRKLAFSDIVPEVQPNAWLNAAGDEGWAGILSEAFVLDESRPVYLVCPPELDCLPLLDAALRLLAPRTRWRVTFSTYFRGLAAGLTCAWRCVIAGTASADEAARSGARRIDLTQSPGPAPDTPGAVAAREGRAVPLPRPADS